MFVPGVMVPQSMLVNGMVQLAFEYTPKFADVFILPLDVSFCELVVAAKVVTVNTVAIRTSAIIDAVMESVIFGVFVPLQNQLVS